VTLSEGGTQLGTATVSSKVTTVTIPANAGLTPGVHTLDVAYSGDGNLTSGATTVQVTVAKAPAVITATPDPKRARVGRDVTLDVTVTGSGSPATGDVQVSVDGGAPITATLVNGAATVDLGSFSAAGAHTVIVDYLGSDTVAAGEKTITVNIKP
jgi:hypothetical protein